MKIDINTWKNRKQRIARRIFERTPNVHGQVALDEISLEAVLCSRWENIVYGTYPRWLTGV